MCKYSLKLTKAQKCKKYNFTDCSAPFRVHIRTNEATATQPNDNVAPTATTQARGVCLQYQQLAC